MSNKKSQSTNINDYQILIRQRGEGEYAAYCPQLNTMLPGKDQEKVYGLMIEHINKHIENLKQK